MIYRYSQNSVWCYYFSDIHVLSSDKFTLYFQYMKDRLQFRNHIWTVYLASRVHDRVKGIIFTLRLILRRGRGLSCTIYWCEQSRYFSDLQNVNITLRILFRPKPSRLPEIFMNIGEDYDERILPSITNEVLKAVVVRLLIAFPRKCISDSFVFNSTGSIWRERFDYSKRVGIATGKYCHHEWTLSYLTDLFSLCWNVGQRGFERASRIFWTYTRRCILDSFDVRARIHLGCRSQASSPARRRKSTFCCRKGNDGVHFFFAKSGAFCWI